MVPSSLMFALLVVLVLFTIMYVSRFGNVEIPESSPIREKAARFSMSHLFFNDVTSCFFLLLFLRIM